MYDLELDASLRWHDELPEYIQQMQFVWNVQLEKPKIKMEKYILKLLEF